MDTIDYVLLPHAGEADLETDEWDNVEYTLATQLKEFSGGGWEPLSVNFVPLGGRKFIQLVLARRRRPPAQSAPDHLIASVPAAGIS